MQQWSDGVYLLGQYNPFRTGCWLLCSGGEGAVLEFPPYNRDEVSPAVAAQEGAVALGVRIRYLLCSHAHGDHFSWSTLGEIRARFPEAALQVQAGFPRELGPQAGAHFFDEGRQLSLGGEPLYLVHAPKHSWTDTMVIFRGVIFTGDWELNMLRSVHDGKGRYSVPRERKLQSIDTMLAFPRHHNYYIHKVFSVHANDRREDVDFVALMQDTKIER